MKRKAFNVMIFDGCPKQAILKEVFGYFKNLQAQTVFVYYNANDRKWYIVDLLTGMAISDGRTMYLAEEQFISDLKKYREYKNTETYLNKISKYQKLLKENKE